MPREIFGHVTAPPVSLGNRKWYTVPLSLAAHVLAIIPIVLVPLLATDVLPLPHDYDVFVVSPPAPPEPPAPPRPAQPKQPEVNRNLAPTEAPDEIKPETELQQTPPADIGGGIDPGGIPGGSDVVTAAPAPAPAPPVVQKPVPVGGHIKMPSKLRDAAPIYPPVAILAHVQGIVILEAVISVDGRIQNLRVLRGVPLLDQAAIDAVRQWEYSPTLLNGVPVPVVTTITVSFTLDRK